MKKILVGFMALALLTTSIAGCSGKTSSGGTTTAVNTAGTQASTTAAKSPDLFVKSDKAEKVVWLLNNSRNAPDNNAVEKRIKEKLKENLNIDLTINAIPAANYKEKVNLLFASGEQVDLFGFAGLTYNDFIQYAERNGLADITALYNKYKSKLGWLVQGTAKNQTDLDVMKYASLNGKMYGLGVYLPVAQTLTFMRKDWLDKLGMSLKDGDSITLDKFYEIAKAMKDKDPDGNGQNDTTAMIGVSGDNIASILGAFGVSADTYLLNNNEVFASNVEPNMKNALTFLNKLYSEGLILKDSPVMKGAQVSEAYAKGKAGIAISNWTHRYSMQGSYKQKELFKDSEWIAVGTVVGSDTMGVKGAKGYKAFAPINCLHAIPATSKNAETVVKMISYMYNDTDLYKTISFGVPGVHHNYTDADGVKFTPEGEELRKANWITAYRTLETHTTNPSLKAEKSIIDIKFPEDAKFYRLAAEQPVYNDLFYGISTKEFVDYNNDLQTRKDEVFTKIIVGESQIKAFDEWVDFWKKNGGQKILDAGVAEYNKRFGTSYKAKKY